MANIDGTGLTRANLSDGYYKIASEAMQEQLLTWTQKVHGAYPIMMADKQDNSQVWELKKYTISGTDYYAISVPDTKFRLMPEDTTGGWVNGTPIVLQFITDENLMATKSGKFSIGLNETTPNFQTDKNEKATDVYLFPESVYLAGNLARPAARCENALKGNNPLEVIDYGVTGYFQFLLIPTYPYGTNYPVPFNLGLKDNSGSSELSRTWTGETVYPTFYTTNEWATRAFQYQIRWTKKEWDRNTGDWVVTEKSDGWQTGSRQNITSTLITSTIGISTAYKQASYGKQSMIIEYDVRILYNNKISNYASYSVTYITKPEIKNVTLAWNSDGLVFSCQSTFDGAPVTIGLNSLKNSSGLEVTNQGIQEFQFLAYFANNAIAYYTIPFSRFKDFGDFEKGETYTLELWVRTNYGGAGWFPTFKVKTPAMKDGVYKIYDDYSEYTYKASDYELIDYAQAKLNLTYPKVGLSTGTVGAHTYCAEHDTITIEGTSTTNNVKTPYPQMVEYNLLLHYKDTAKKTFSMLQVKRYEKQRYHVFDWGDDALVLWLMKDEPINEEWSFEADTTTSTLNGRKHDVVNYLTAHDNKNYTSVTSTVKGWIVPEVEKFGTTARKVEDMVEVGHVTYSSPYGRVATVAITGASVNTQRGLTEVSVELIEEDFNEYEAHLARGVYT